MKKFNVIDILIILGVIGAIGGGIWFFSTTAATDDGYVEFVVELRQAMPYFTEQLLPGMEIRDSIRNHVLGRVVEFWQQPAVTMTFNYETNTFSNVVVPDRYDVYILIRGRGSWNDSHILTEGQPVRVGMDKFLRARGVAGIGVVVDVTTISN
ncbi:MAG: DUF4330 domain-containing protein [Defluviitaleaceae bacterium]|nr:DUF4330 domain-containing protein [Defluviitaleaceae bacterium]